MDNYEEYEKEVAADTKRNKKYLEEFESWLKKKGYVSKTINNHVSNVDFYLNDYLNYYNAIKMEEGIKEVDNFLGDWFIRKCMWSTEYTIKTTAASIKKFYACMLELGHIKEEDYKFLVTLLKDEMEVYIDKVNEYNNFDDDWF